jgi:ATP-dependent helicase/nuclease subunit B
VSLKRDGDFDAYSAVLDEEEFAGLLQHVEVLLRQLSEEIMRGRAKIDPVMIEQRKACDYCEYLAICQFDQLLENNRYRRLPKLSRGEVISRVSPERGER